MLYPASQKERESFSQDLINQAADLALHASTAYPLALNSLTPSEARELFASKAFASYRSSLEGRQKVTLSILARFDNVLRGMTVIGKILNRRR